MDRLRYRRIWDAEAGLLRQFPRICTLTPEMSGEVRMIHPQAKVDTVPLGMNLENYSFGTMPDEDSPTVTMIGSLDWLPTRTATIRLLTRLFPRIREQIPSVSLRIVGRNARSILANHIGVPGVTIEENVPDILPYFRQATVLLYAPERGCGMKVKVLESFALGLPVVTTQSGVEGIPAVDGVHAGICEDDAGLIERCVSLLKDRNARFRQREAARGLVETWCSADVVLDTLEGIYEEMVA
jgi:glycosyltransferase involved in cell wall biosynthesis